MEKALLNTRCVIKACTRLQIPFTAHDEFGNFVEVHGRTPLFFVNFATPWNDGATNALCGDKEFTYRLLHTHLQMPETHAYFDPTFTRAKYTKFKTHSTRDEIVAEIQTQCTFPVIVKMNSGSRKRNVFLCNNPAQIKRALNSIFNKRSQNYDYIALAQTYIDIAQEYRVIVFNKRVLLVYKKNSRCEIVNNQNIIEKITAFIQPIFTRTHVQFAGLDVAVDTHDTMFLLEMNSKPGFDGFARHNSEEAVVQLFEKMLKEEK